MQNISAPQLATWLRDTRDARDTQREHPVLIDVREPWEFNLCHIDGSIAIPMSRISQHWSDLNLNPEAEIVVICHHGQRSLHAGLFLEHQGFSHVTNLVGGIAAWAHQVEPAMPTY